MIDAADALKVITRIRTYHAPQDIGNATARSWAEALNLGGVTSARDAELAVIALYSTPGANQWVTPGDVIEKYREIRNQRLSGIDYGDVTRDIDARDGQAYVATVKRRYAAIADGATLAEANALPLPPEARHAALTGPGRRQIEGSR